MTDKQLPLDVIALLGLKFEKQLYWLKINVGFSISD